MSNNNNDFSASPDDLELRWVDDPFIDDACQGCYYWKERTEVCQHPNNPTASCSTRERDGDLDYENFIFVEKAVLS